MRYALQSQRWLALGLAVLSLVPLVRWAPQMGELQFGSMQHTLQWGLRTINGWWWLMAVLGFGWLHLNLPHPALGVLGQAVLPFYMLHQTVIVMLGYAMRDWPLGILPKYLLPVTVAFTISASLYALLIRRSRVLRFLFGMDTASAWPAGLLGAGQGGPLRSRGGIQITNVDKQWEEGPSTERGPFFLGLPIQQRWFADGSRDAPATQGLTAMWSNSLCRCSHKSSCGLRVSENPRLPRGWSCDRISIADGVGLRSSGCV